MLTVFAVHFPTINDAEALIRLTGSTYTMIHNCRHIFSNSSIRFDSFIHLFCIPYRNRFIFRWSIGRKWKPWLWHKEVKKTPLQNKEQHSFLWTMCNVNDLLVTEKKSPFYPMWKNQTSVYVTYCVYRKILSSHSILQKTINFISFRQKFYCDFFFFFNWNI